MAFRTAPLFLGRIVPWVTIARVTPFIWRERTDVKHSIAGNSRLPQPTLVPALIGSCIGFAVERRNQGTPLVIRPKIMVRYEEAAASLGWLLYNSGLVLPYHAYNMQQTEQIPNDPPRIGAKSTTTSNHPSTPAFLVALGMWWEAQELRTCCS